MPATRLTPERLLGEDVVLNHSLHRDLPRSERDVFRSRRRMRLLFQKAAIVLLLSLLKAAPARPSTGPTISIGPGPSSIVEYDFQFRPLHVFVGFRKPTDITPLAGGSLLVADEGAQEVLAFDPSTGNISYRHQFPSGVLRARPRPFGGLVVTSTDKVLLTDRALKVEREISVKGVRAGAELRNGHILTVSNEDQGWMTERRPDGSIVWQSKPRARLNPGGKSSPEEAEQTFVSTSSLDVGEHEEIFATDYDAGRMHLLSKDHQVLRFWTVPGMTHFLDARLGPNGELIAVSPEAHSVWTERGDGKVRTWTSSGTDLPLCANVSRRGTILVGFEWRPENERLNATLQLSTQHKRLPFHRTLPGALLLGISAAILICAGLRWRDTRSAPARRQTNDNSPIHERTAGSPVSMDEERSSGGVRAVQVGGATVALVLAALTAWRTTLEAGGVAPGKMIRFALACAIGAIALKSLNGILGTNATFSSFSPTQSDDPTTVGHARHPALLLALALSSLSISLLAVLFLPDHPGLAVGTWIMAQILILVAAFERTAPGTGHSRRGAFATLFGVVLFAAIFTRFWELGQYPDFVHWDHAIYGSAALKILRGEWSPFFIMEPSNHSVPRPWEAVCALLLGLFGAHYWVLRLTAAISGVALVVGTYLLGSSLLNRRAGLAAAFLVSVNHVLLLYSRQSYVMDPAALFVLALYCATVGLRSGRRFFWCLSGVLSGWCLLTYWASTVLAVVGATIVGAFALFYPRWLWRRHAGLIWLLLGAAAVYLPMVPHMRESTSLGSRLRETTAILTPDGSIRRDPAFWKSQLEQTFGTILQHGEGSSWNVSTGKPLVFGPETVLFGVGLIYLLISRQRAPAMVLLLWIGVGFFLGNGLFPTPNFYHCLAAIPPIFFVSAVTVDRVLALSDPWKSPLRTALILPALLMLALIGSLNLRAVWSLVGRSPSLQANGRLALRADFRSIVPRYIRENPNHRYYLVRTSTDLSCAEASFIFFADDSDISDMTKPPQETLPVPPTAPPRDVAFIVLPGLETRAAFIRTIYPNARTVELRSTVVPKPVLLLLVDANSVRQAFEARPLERSSGVGRPSPDGDRSFPESRQMNRTYGHHQSNSDRGQGGMATRAVRNRPSEWEPQRFAISEGRDSSGWSSESASSRHLGGEK
jgi:4-amino-4-deoxy-L-arabinose transferase-like glycosyltransferase